MRRHRGLMACRVCSLGIVASQLLVTAALGQEVEIHHLQVGQGDATLIRGPAGAGGVRTTVLVDSGDHRSVNGGQIVREHLDRLGITSLDFFIATHYDADHVGGVVAGGNHQSSFVYGPNRVPGAAGDDDGDNVTNWLPDQNGDPKPFFKPDPEEVGLDDDIPIGTFVDYGDITLDTQVGNKYADLARASNRVVLDDQADVDTFEINLGGGAMMIAVAANGFVRDRPTRVASVNTKNERSLCFVLRFGGFDYLIGGDMTGRSSGGENAQVELAVGQFLVSQGILIDVLHVNHHGADNASEKLFLEAIDPEIAIISLGNGNTHEHPRREALERLEDAGVLRIIQTEWGTTPGEMPEEIRDNQAIYQGDIVIRTDGQSYEISTSSVFQVDQ